MRNKPQKSIVMSAAVSIAFHLLLVFCLDLPARHLARRDSVAFTIHTPQTEPSKQIASTSSSPVSVPQESPKSVPQREPKPTSSATAPPQTAAAAAAPIGNGDGTLSTADSAKGTASSSIIGASKVIDASFDRSSFKQPEYTVAALAALYEASVVATIFVHEDGTIGDIKLDQPLLHDMEPRLIQAIRSARFTPAQNINGKTIPTWLRIRFKLVISK